MSHFQIVILKNRKKCEKNKFLKNDNCIERRYWFLPNRTFQTTTIWTSRFRIWAEFCADLQTLQHSRQPELLDSVSGQSSVLIFKLSNTQNPLHYLIDNKHQCTQIQILYEHCPPMEREFKKNKQGIERKQKYKNLVTIYTKIGVFMFSG